MKKSKRVSVKKRSESAAKVRNKAPSENESRASHSESDGADFAAPLRDANSPKAGFPVVGIGASAGGLEALDELFREMPSHTGMAFVVVTHQHPGHASLLPDLLGRIAKLPVTEASDGVILQPDHVYVGPPGGHLAILNGALHRMETGTSEAPRLPIDYFLRSLAADQKEKAICIILSGTGTDGTLGLKAIKAELGMAMVQHVHSAKYTGMPSSAIATGLADYVLPPAAMPEQLMEYGRATYKATAAEAEAPALPAEPMQKIFVLLRSRTGNDFSNYKDNTIRRRIKRRMNLHQIEEPNQYLRYLQQNPHELDILFKELLISVTGFFRDTEAFEALAKTLVSELLQSLPDDYVIRTWVPGCATGEEVYSVAILARECMEFINRRWEMQIFGTDLDSEAITVARNGLYPDGIAMDLAPQRLQRFFIRDGNRYRIRKEIREMTVFAVQNIIKDPPFTRLDLISCRNLLIYLNADLQKRLLPIFHYALRPGGLLFLGPSETIGSFTDLFETLDKRWKIFRRKKIVPSLHPAMELPTTRVRADAAERELNNMPTARETNIVGIVERLLVGRFAPPSVVVNDRGDVVYIHGRTGAYLEPAAGKPPMNVLDMAREGLQLKLASALRQAAADKGEVVHDDVRVKSNGGYVHVNLSVAKIHEPETLRGLLLITFGPRSGPSPLDKGGSRRHKRRDPGHAEKLESELESTKQSLQNTIEELETSNEELKSTNEELQSTNEEMQSVNEELETSKEEMQSLNEELSTVNAELEAKVEELSRSNDDMRNLLNSTEIATIFLDGDLKISRFTEEAKHLINLISTDVGRPIADLTSHLDHENLLAECEDVLRTLRSKERQVRAKSGRWYLLRIAPYRTSENVVEGLVLTFVDITAVTEAQTGLRRLATIVRDSNDAITVQDFTGVISAWNRGAERMYGWSEAAALKMNIRNVVPEAKRVELDTLVERLKAGETVEAFETERLTRDGRSLRVWLTATLLADDAGQPVAIATTERDISERKT